jgi:hypothetical protein
MSGVKLFFLLLFGLLACIACVIVGVMIYQVSMLINVFSSLTQRLVCVGLCLIITARPDA